MTTACEPRGARGFADAVQNPSLCSACKRRPRTLHIDKASVLVADDMEFDEEILGAEFLRAGYGPGLPWDLHTA